MSARPHLRPIISERVFAISVLAIVALSLILRLMALNPFIADPDEGEYLNIARHLAKGDGFIMSIKWHFFDQKPAVHSAIGERPLLFPIVLSVAWRLWPTIVAGKMLNIIIGIIACFVFYSLAQGLMPRHYAMAATALLLLNPVLISASRSLMPEPTFILLVLCAMLITLKASSPLHWGGAGVVSGLSYLARQEGVTVFAIIVLCLLVCSRRRQALFVSLGFAMAITPYLIANWAMNGSPIYSVQSYHFRVRSFPGEGMTDPFRTEFPGVLAFIRQNFAWLAIEIPWRAAKHFDDLLSRRFLSLIALLAVFGVLGQQKEHGGRMPDLVLWSALALFAIPSFVWSAPYRPGFLLPSYTLLLLLCFRGLWLLSKRIDEYPRARWVIMIPLVIVLLLYMAVNVNDLANPDKPILNSIDDLEFVQIAQRIAVTASPRAVVATHDPWTLNTLTERPSILLPTSAAADRDKLIAFVRLYSPEYMLVRNCGVGSETWPGYHVILSCSPVDEAAHWTLLEREKQ